VGEPVNIAALQRFAADADLKKIKPVARAVERKNKKAAIIGAGPAGISCAIELYKKGWDVVIYEKTDRAGGLLVWGIPAYRLPRDVVKQEVSVIEGTEIKLMLNAPVDRDKFAEITASSDAVFLASGLSGSSKPNIAGEDLPGACQALDFLLKMNEGKPYAVGKKVVVIGGGSTALDCASSSVRLGAEDVSIYYRRTESEMPGAKAEFAEAKEAGVKFVWLAAPKKIVGDGKIEGVEFVKCELGEPDASGRPRPKEISCSEYVVPADTVIFALGQKLGTDMDYIGEFVDAQRGRIQFDKDTLRSTKNPKIFVGGDIASGGGTVAWAVADGKKAAEEIDKTLGA
jgi:glutamate synthase (NADPH/NADH) small chain